MDFEKNMNELEKIVKMLEDGNLTLNEMIKLYEKGMKISVDCCKILDEAELKINTFAKTENGLEKVPFSDIDM